MFEAVSENFMVDCIKDVTEVEWNQKSRVTRVSGEDQSDTCTVMCPGCERGKRRD